MKYKSCRKAIEYNIYGGKMANTPLYINTGSWAQVFHFECCNIYIFKLDFEYLHG